MASIFTISAPDHEIKSVTVFKSLKAEVVRTFPLDLKVGQNKIIIKGLPSIIDTHSVRVSGFGNARLSDVVCTVGTSKGASYAPDSPWEIIRALYMKKMALEGEKRVREHEADLLVNYGKTMSREHVAPNQMVQFLQSFVDQGCKNLEELKTISEKIVGIERQIEREYEKDLSRKGAIRGEVTIILSTDASYGIDLKLTYLVSGVNWKPSYELHATTENGKPSPTVALHYRARISQSTGEDWTDTALTLSTVSSGTVAKKIPELTPVKIRPRANTLIYNNVPNHDAPIGGSGNNQSASNQETLQSQLAMLGQQAVGNSGGTVLSPGSGPRRRGPASGTLRTPQGTLALAGVAPGALHGSSTGTTPGFGFGSQDSQRIRGAVAPGISFGSSTGTIPAPISAPAVPAPNQEIPGFEDIPPPNAMAESTTIVTETPVAVSYSVRGKSTIPTDGIEHQVSVAVLSFEATVSYVAIPRIEPRVYLQCQVKNTSEYRLLSGPITVILDDSYVSQTFINDINTGDNFDCTLGDDTVTKVTYSRSSRTVEAARGAFSEPMNTTTYTTKITVHNKHQFAIPDLVVRDLIPTCDDKRAKIILREPKDLADAKDGEVVKIAGKEGLKVMWGHIVDGKGGEKEGKFEWTSSVAAGVEVSLESEWELKASADATWVE